MILPPKTRLLDEEELKGVDVGTNRTGAWPGFEKEGQLYLWARNFSKKEAAATYMTRIELLANTIPEIAQGYGRSQHNELSFPELLGIYVPAVKHAAVRNLNTNGIQLKNFSQEKVEKYKRKYLNLIQSYR